MFFNPETEATRKMPSSVALVRTDVSEECIVTIIRVTRTGELATEARYEVFLSRRRFLEESQDVM
jgi:hypothetical protein